MANEQNLKPFTSNQSREEAKKNGKKGGVASGKARRQKKALRETLNELLSMPLRDGKIEDIKKVKGFFDLNGKNITVQDALVMKAIETAMKGNAKSMKMLFDLMAETNTRNGPEKETDPLSKAFEELENVQP